MKINANNTLHIAIIGAGFTGTALAANLYVLRNRPLRITLVEKRSKFGLGEAYSTPYLYHLLNVRAKDMSAFEYNLTHFTAWLLQNKQDDPLLEKNIPLVDQFVPRAWYGEYLQNLLSDMQDEQDFHLQLVQGEAVDISADGKVITLDDHAKISADKIIFALGNGAPSQFSSAIAENVHCIQNAWDFTAPKKIPKESNVMIVGTGLSMIDAVLTLHEQHHQGKIFALSRRGLLPLRHTDLQGAEAITEKALPEKIQPLFHALRTMADEKKAAGIDWRLMINGFRAHFPRIWENASMAERKRFLRHVLPYWNIHRHRVHDGIADVLQMLVDQHQLEIISGRLIEMKDGQAHIKPRGQAEQVRYQIDWLINCMGPSMYMQTKVPLIKALLDKHLVTLDELKLGFAIAENFAFINSSGTISSQLFALGPPAKGVNWTCSSVPEIRRQCAHLARQLLAFD